MTTTTSRASSNQNEQYDLFGGNAQDNSARGIVESFKEPSSGRIDTEGLAGSILSEKDPTLVEAKLEEVRRILQSKAHPFDLASFDREVESLQSGMSEKSSIDNVNVSKEVNDLALSIGTIDTASFRGREKVRWEEYGSAPAILGFLYDQAIRFVSTEIEVTEYNGGDFWAWYEKSDSGKHFQAFGRSLLDEINRALDPDEQTRSYDFIGQLTASVVDAYDRGELLPGAMSVLSSEYEGVVSAAADICHALNYLQDVNGTPEQRAKVGLQDMIVDMLTMKYLGNEAFRNHTNNQIIHAFEKRLSGGDDVGVILGRTMTSMAIGSHLNPIQYLALVGGGTYALDVAIDASHLSNEDLLDIYSKLQKISPQQREAFLEEQFSDLVSIDELVQGAIFGQGLSDSGSAEK